MALTLFDILNEICESKKDLDFDDPEIFKIYDIYMINRYLSMIEIFVPIVQCVNYGSVEKRDHYNFLRNIIPSNRYRFNYIKKDKDEKLETILKCLCKYFEIGMREAKMYMELLKKEHIEELKIKYSYGKNGKKLSIEEDVC